MSGLDLLDERVEVAEDLEPARQPAPASARIALRSRPMGRGGETETGDVADHDATVTSEQEQVEPVAADPECSIAGR